jgi:acyl-CoA synthetase (AMP-forming)/AMP-acid ligase II
VELAGPTLFSGYLNRPDATAAAMTSDGWLRSGDLGAYDDEHGLRLFGRLATDLIKTGGFKVGAGEIEDALLAHPAVAEVAVTGEPDDDLGERIVAWVVVRESVDAESLIDHVAQSLAPHKRPRDVRFVDALPRNPMGKVQKKLLTG